MIVVLVLLLLTITMIITPSYLSGEGAEEYRTKQKTRTNSR